MVTTSTVPPGSGAWLPFDRSYYLQDVVAQRHRPVARYVVRYYLYGASTALTYIIILGILPTFWGYWVLARKPTLGPVDMARAFNAPYSIR
jgi:hypothetical protein